MSCGRNLKGIGGNYINYFINRKSNGLLVVERKTIGLLGDGDDLDLIEDIEASFQIKFLDEDLLHCQTVGDLYELLRVKYPETSLGRGGCFCASHRAFNEVRRVIGAALPIKVKPSTRLSGLGLASHRGFRKALQQELQLKTPGMSLSFFSSLFFLVGVAASVGLIAVYELSWAWLLLSILALWIFGALVLPRRFYGTVGGFAKKLTAFNYDHYVQQGAHSNDETVWQALVILCEEHCGTSRKVIAPTTRLLAKA